MNKVLAITLANLIGAFFTGCITNTDENYNLVSNFENNSGKDIAKEVAQVSQAFQYKNFSGILSLAKPSATTSAELNLSTSPWTYGNGWWKRSGELSAKGEDGANGSLKGSDDVQFQNAQGDVVQFPIIQSATQGKVKHSAQLYLQGKRGGYWDIGRDFTLKGVITEESGDAILTVNGDLTQYLKAENAEKTQSIHVKGTAEATDVRWKKNEDSWGTPISGTVDMESNYKIIRIVFEPGVAHVTVEGKTDDTKKNYDVTITETTP